MIPPREIERAPGAEESAEACEIRAETVRGNAPHLPAWWKSKCRRTRKMIHVYTNLSH